MLSVRVSAIICFFLLVPLFWYFAYFCAIATPAKDELTWVTERDIVKRRRLKSGNGLRLYFHEMERLTIPSSLYGYQSLVVALEEGKSLRIGFYRHTAHRIYDPFFASARIWQIEIDSVAHGTYMPRFLLNLLTGCVLFLMGGFFFVVALPPFWVAEQQLKKSYPRIYGK